MGDPAAPVEPVDPFPEVARDVTWHSPHGRCHWPCRHTANQDVDDRRERLGIRTLALDHLVVPVGAVTSDIRRKIVGDKVASRPDGGPNEHSRCSALAAGRPADRCIVTLVSGITNVSFGRTTSK